MKRMFTAQHHVSAIAVAALFQLAHMSGAATRYVSLTGGNTPPYTNWSDAATSIQAAVNVCNPGDEVLVAAGEYAHLGSSYDNGCVVFITNAIALRGTPPLGAVITGSGVRRGVVLYDTSSASIDGFVISNCFVADASGGIVRGGAGIYIHGSSGVVVSNCHITHNTSLGTYAGGGVYAKNSGVRTLVDCIIAHNTAVKSGGGVRSENGIVVDRCLLAGNRADYGGGIYLFSTGLVRNCLLYGNLANMAGGGAYFDYSSSMASTKASLINCTVTDNRSPEGSGVVFARPTEVVNSIMIANQGNNATNYGAFAYTNCCVWPLPQGPYNISTDPQFLSASLRDYRLSTNSPCRNTGLNHAWMAAARDLNGHGRVSEGTVDRGCYELGALACSFTPVPAHGLTPLDVVLSVALSGTNIDGATAHWDLTDDGSTDAEGLSITNLYAVEGLYTVALAVSNTAGEADAWLQRNAVYVYDTNIHYVAPSGAAVFPYTTWANAATSVADAVAAAFDAHTVLITNGEYFLADEVTITRAITLRGVNGRDATVLAGNRAAQKRCLSIDDADAVVDGVTISNGNLRIGDVYGQPYNGGGVYISRRGTLQNARVTRCDAINGGGIYLFHGGIVSNCIISTNIARQVGGGIECFGRGRVLDCDIFLNALYLTWSGAGAGVEKGFDVRFERCAIYDNTAYGTMGGGMHLENTVSVHQCHIYNNTTQRDGGGIYVYIGPAHISECVISNNVSTRSRDGAGQGAGLLLYGVSTVESSVICMNRGALDGAGIMAYNHQNMPAGFLVSNCTIYGNTALSIGGGAAITSIGDPNPFAGAIRACNVYGNWARNSAGGVALYDVGFADQCAISNNYCAGSGAGLMMVFYANKSFARNSLIVNNVASNYGGGIALYNGTLNTYVENCTVADNTALLGGGGVYFSNGGAVSNSIVYYNTPDNWAFSNTNYRIRYTCTIPRPSGAVQGNITNAPQFAGRAGGNYRLAHTSPCINAGYTLPWMPASSDFFGQPRVRYGAVDMGCHEVQDFAALWCAFSASPTNVLIDEPVVFSAATDGTSSLAQLVYAWDFNALGTPDVALLAAPVVTHAYTLAGLYSVALAVSNTHGDSAAHVQSNYISVLPESCSVFPLLAWCTAVRWRAHR